MIFNASTIEREKLNIIRKRRAYIIHKRRADFKTSPGFFSTSTHWIMIEALTIKTKQIFNT